jgi:hypothetical protein
MKLLCAAAVLLATLLSGNQALARTEDTFLLSSAISFEELALVLQDTLNGAIFF